MLVTDLQGRWVLIAPFNRCHVGQPERFALRDQGRIADLLQFIESAVEADKDLRPARFNRARRG